MRITTAEYILIAVGIFTLGIMVGFLILGVVAWRIGTRMEKEGEIEDNSSNANALCSCPECTQYMDMMEQESTSIKSGRDTFKLEEYSEITLEDGK